MNDATKRSILRWVHIVFSVPVIGYVYSPFARLPDYAPVVRYVAIPVIGLSALWMWKGHWVRRLFLQQVGRKKERDEKDRQQAVF